MKCDEVKCKGEGGKMLKIKSSNSSSVFNGDKICEHCLNQMIDDNYMLEEFFVIVGNVLILSI